MSITRSSLREQSEPSSLDFSQSHKKYSFFIFVDPYCGLGCGKAFLKLEVTGQRLSKTERICFLLDGDNQSDRIADKQRRSKYDIHTHFYDMSCSRSMEVACERLKALHNQKHRKVRLIACGDESTICSIAMFFEQQHVAIENYPFAIIPSGFINDLSSILGWGDVQSNELVGQDLKWLKNYARKWVKAIPQKIDVWTVSLQVDPEDGAIQTVDRQQRIKVYEKQKSLDMLMISHLNIGVHARIDLGFDLKKSSQSSVANKWIHAFEGFKKCIMVSIVEFEAKENGEDRVYKTLFSTKRQKGQGSQGRYLEGSPVSLVCLNIGTYRGEAEAWKEADEANNRNPTDSKSQSYYDGKLQFLTYNSVASKHGVRICQTEGDICMRLQRQNPAYVQVDGACFKLTSPKQIKILKKCKLQVLINSDSLK